MKLFIDPYQEYDCDLECDDEDREMTPLAKRHNEIVNERYNSNAYSDEEDEQD